MGGRRTTIWTLACVLVGVGVRAAASSPSRDSYQAIVDRNVFDLHAPPPKADADALQPKAQIPKLTLNGITTILGKKVTVITVPPSKPGVPQTTLMLAEGQAQNEVEVRQIDEKAGAVKVINHGEEQMLDFEHDGAKPSPVPAKAATPLVIPQAPTSPPATTIPSPGANTIRPLRTLPLGATTPPHGTGIQAPQ
jgi:hypothetical protein